MVLHIMGQRISASAAFTIFDRLTAAGGSAADPRSLMALGADRLRALGLSWARSGASWSWPRGRRPGASIWRT